LVVCVLGLATSAMSNDAGVLDAGVMPSPLTAKRIWTKRLTGVGTSSPRAVDLNGDGVLDVVVGGGNEAKAGWVYTLDGKSGNLLWKAKFKEEFYATPTLVDVNADHVPDVFIGGRDFDWSGLDGRSGKKLWSLRQKNPDAAIDRRNFNGALVVPDQDGDGALDLAVTQGGSCDDSKRLPGHLFVISAAAGTILRDVAMPDGRETYSIPALLSPQPLELIVGTGGETITGHMMRLSLSAPDGGTALGWSIDTGTQGAIPSPFVTPGDGGLDVVAGFHGSRSFG
jgi:FG-GAP-like repeat